MSDVFESIINWNKDRGLVAYNHVAQAQMLEEELNEFKEATTKHSTVDALCDLVVVAIGGIWKLGYDPTKALQETLKEIHSRTGSFNPDTGKWHKDETKRSEWYTANYANAEHSPSGDPTLWSL